MKQTIGIFLIAVGLLMALGFSQAQLTQGPLAVFFAVLIAVVLPLGGGAFLLWESYRSQRVLKASKSSLAQKTLRAEILKLAAQNEGRLTVLEVTQAFALDQAQAEAALDALALEGLADHQLTDEGLLVYHFSEVQQLKNKAQSKRLEEL